MRPIERSEILPIGDYEAIRPHFRARVIAEKQPRRVALGEHMSALFENRDAPWILWIKDLASADPYYILPVIMIVSMIIQTKLNPTPPDPIQAKMMMAMPFIFGVMFLWFPAGLVLYWVVNNILSIAQQWQITRMIEAGGKAANDAKA